MGTEENKALVRRAIDEFFNKGDLGAADRLFDNNYIWNPGDGVSAPMDRETHKSDYSKLRAAFPDLNLQVEDMIAEGDKVVTRCTITGTHQGVLSADYGDLQPTNKSVTWTAVAIHRIANGKIVEGHINYDRTGTERQLGVQTSAPSR